MSIFQQLKDIFNQPDPDVLFAFQYKIPRSITVCIEKNGNFYTARVEKINDEEMNDSTVITEAESMPELVDEINDMILTYLDFPENVKPRMPKLLPPEYEAKALQALRSDSYRELTFAK